MSPLERAWYKRAAWLYLLWPLSLVYAALAGLVRLTSKTNTSSPPVPVIVVGNISVGGTGKTPTVMALANGLLAQGRRPGIVSRGYGGKASHYPLCVTPETPVWESGDEASLLAKTLAVPVVVDPDRARALNTLLAEHQVDVVISDDGLQHQRLPRSLEWVLIDGERGLGNGLLLPAGPLREKAARLKRVDALLVNGDVNEEAARLWRGLAPKEYAIEVEALGFTNQKTGERLPFSSEAFPGTERLHVITGIGNPDRFFRLLAPLGLPLQTHVFPDHHRFSEQDMPALEPGDQLVMTAKDGVKCSAFAGDNFWTVDARISLPEPLLQTILNLIKEREASP